MRTSFTVRSVAVVTAAVATLFGAAACSNSSDDSSNATTTTAVQADGFEISTPAGEVSLSLDGDLPSGWPDDFPLPDGAEPAGSGSLGGADSGVQVGVFSADGSPSEVFDFYDGNADLSPSDQNKADVGSTFVGTMDISGDFDGSITVTGRNDTTYVVAVLTTDGAS